MSDSILPDTESRIAWRFASPCAGVSPGSGFAAAFFFFFFFFFFFLPFLDFLKNAAGVDVIDAITGPVLATAAAGTPTKLIDAAAITVSNR